MITKMKKQKSKTHKISPKQIFTTPTSLAGAGVSIMIATFVALPSTLAASLTTSYTSAFYDKVDKDKHQMSVHWKYNENDGDVKVCAVCVSDYSVQSAKFFRDWFGVQQSAFRDWFGVQQSAENVTLYRGEVVFDNFEFVFEFNKASNHGNTTNDTKITNMLYYDTENEVVIEYVESRGGAVKVNNVEVDQWVQSTKIGRVCIPEPSFTLGLIKLLGSLMLGSRTKKLKRPKNPRL